MDWTSIGPLVAQAAPTIGGLLGGFIPFPGGAILGKLAGTILAEALGTAPTPSAVSEALKNGDPAEIQSKLTGAEARMQAEVEQLRAQLADVQDARATEIKMIESGSSIAYGPVVLSVLITTGFIGCIFSLMLLQISFSDTSGQAFLLLTGVLVQAFAQVCGYWLGSSSGSVDKSAQIAALAGVVVNKPAPKIAPRK